MKVLLVTPACHFAKAGAAQEDIYATIRHAQELGHTVALYTLDSPAQTHETLDAVRRTYGIDVRMFRPRVSTVGWLRSALRRFSTFDRSAYVFAQLAADAEFLRYLNSERPDVLFSFCSYSWPVLDIARRLKIRSVMRSHNFEPAFFFESLDPLHRLNPVNVIRYLAKLTGERRAVRSCDVVATLPFQEVALYRRWKDPQRVNILTLMFLDKLLRAPDVHRGKRPLDVFFLGASYNVSFHARGANLLITDIAPKVLARAPGAFRFHICGGKLPTELAARCDGREIIAEGYVDDLEAFLRRMDIGAFPVMTGKTIKGKIFHSLCQSFPTVMPTIGKGGYDLKDGQEALIADTSDVFVEAILSLQDDTLRQRLADGAARFCEAHFNTKRIQASLADVLTSR